MTIPFLCIQIYKAASTISNTGAHLLSFTAASALRRVRNSVPRAQRSGKVGFSLHRAVSLDPVSLVP
jgi:hypothetical protein